ncbi:MAG: hypothetical protein K9H48_06625 [Melioribacteraceae bacterium]|nr:hypothetical protein [Melioribacteraceae bacterium]MCF8393335.1 hypothetical protein [Melioribacteraceae bacterium]MCF8418900.1 hypothetical protein [Melioribacteraceae bacterium]
MKTKVSWGLVILFFVLSSTLYSQSVERLISQSDSLTKSFLNQAALDVLKKAEKLEPNNWEVLWRISRAYVDIGEHLPASTGEQEEQQVKTYEMALDYADKAVQAAPERSETYLRRAIANGRIALFKGVFSVADVVNKVRDDSEKAIQLATGGDEILSTSHYVLGRTHAKISEKWAPARAVLGLGWAELEIGLDHFAKAIELRPDYVMFYVDYAIALVEADQENAAIAMLRKALNSPNQDEDDEKRKEEAMAMLKELTE